MSRHHHTFTFFSTTPVFARAEFAQTVGRRPDDRVVTAMLAHHLRAGNIRRIARGVFASVSNPDRFLAASRLREGAVIAYRSALEMHGCTPTGNGEIQLIAPGEPGRVQTTEFVCHFVTPPCHLSASDGVTTVERQGLTVKLTSLERTIIDSLDRYPLAGGAEELFGLLDTVADSGVRLDIDALLYFAARMGNAAAAGVLGFWLDCERARLEVTYATLQHLRAFAPRQSRYALGAKPGRGRAATGWNVILPHEITERYLGG
ncbi:MAG: type IV toxin-antitoxin system AbiEi family antitoxin domain-containing protein [Steroidobacteraceae bacterium]